MTSTPKGGRPRKTAAPTDRPRKTIETAGGLTQTSVYFYPDERAALYQRAAEETAKKGVRVGIGEIIRAAVREHLGLKAD